MPRTMQTVNPMFMPQANSNMMMNPSSPYMMPNFYPMMIPNSPVSPMMISQTYHKHYAYIRRNENIQYWFDD